METLVTTHVNSSEENSQVFKEAVAEHFEAIRLLKEANEKSRADIMA